MSCNFEKAKSDAHPHVVRSWCGRRRRRGVEALNGGRAACRAWPASARPALLWSASRLLSGTNSEPEPELNGKQRALYLRASLQTA